MKLSLVAAIRDRDARRVENMVQSTGPDGPDEIVVVSIGDAGPLRRLPGIRLIEIEHPVFRKGLALNVGIRAAAGDVVMTTDVDILFPSGFFTALRAVPGLAGGGMLATCRTIRIPACPDPVALYRDGSYRGRAMSDMACGGCLAAARYWWDRVRGFDQFYTGWASEDYDVFLRARADGLGIVWMDEILGRPMGHQWHSTPRHASRIAADETERNVRHLKKMEGVVTRNPAGWGES